MQKIIKEYDVAIIGGGTSGIAAAYTAAKNGLKTILLEKNIHLGGSITSGLVIPAMKTDDKGINTQFYTDLVEFAQKYNAQHTYSDGNKGWFNPTLLKIVLDDMLRSVKCDILFDCNFILGSLKENGQFITRFNHKTLSVYIVSDYIVDATADGAVANAFGAEFLPRDNPPQSPTLRFMMSSVDLNKFSWWLIKYDSNRNITTVDNTGSQIHLSTAYTWDDSIVWALKPVFEEAVRNKELKVDDTAYFQVFTVPGMPGSIAFNCPRVMLADNEDISNPFVFSKALIQARERIYRLANFCKKNLPGFENAYISDIADMFGIRESNRIKGKYVYSPKDMIENKTFENVALSSDYPIDIHSNEKSKDKLKKLSSYYLPIESLICENNDKLFVIGRCLSATFESQAALRIQPSCFSMGEAVAKHIYKISQDKKQ